MKHVTAPFSTTDTAEAAVERLVAGGFDRGRISFLVTRDHHHHYFSDETGGALRGLKAGGLFGALGGGLVALAAVAVPGVGLLAAGPLLALLGGAGAGAAGGGFIGLLVGAGLSEEEAHLYKGRLEKGDILVGILTDDPGRAAKAEEILLQAGAVHTPVAMEVDRPELTST